MKTWIVVGGAVAGAVGLAALGLVVVYDAVTKTAPDLRFDDPRVAEHRAEATARLNADLDDFEQRAGGLHVLARGSTDACVRNQHNWKIKDPAAYDCTLRVVRVYSFAGDFRTQASGIGAALRPDGCPPGTTSSTDHVLRQYYDKLKDTEAWDGTPYGPAHLPGSGSGCVPGPAVVPGIGVDGWLSTQPARQHLDRHATNVPRPCRDDLCRVEPVDLAAAVRSAPAGDDWVVIVSTAKTYHSEPWD